ncbi:MAG: ABC transporter ATP-binding protein, partial [Proteobacteria bacterium]|nr:ABC transporter ATP-binding protein [Pseudomonadota bacterium]
MQSIQPNLKRKNSVLSKILFSHAKPILQLGLKRPIDACDIPEAPMNFDPVFASKLFQGFTTQLMSKPDSRFSTVISIGDILWRVRGPLGAMALFSLIMTAFELSGPVLVHRLLTLLESLRLDPANTVICLTYGLGLAAIGVGAGIFGQHYTYKLLQVNMLINSGLGEHIYRKALRLARSERLENSTGDIVNLLGADAEQIQDVGFFVNELMLAIITITGVSIMMAKYLGIAGIVAPVIFLLMIYPCRKLAVYLESIADKLIAQRDQRISFLTQAISCIRIVKAFAWEPFVVNKINEIRSRELALRHKSIKGNALSVVFFRASAAIIGVFTLGVVILLNRSLTAADLFTTMTLIGLLDHPFGMLTEILSTVTAAHVSTGRIERFLRRYEASQDSFSVLKQRMHSDHCRPSVGKTTLLMNCLGESSSEKPKFFHQSSPATFVNRSDVHCAFVPQEPFIMNASLRKNLVLGRINFCDDFLVSRAIELASFDSDVSRMESGLNSEIGEQGINLSGGQKQRLSLARSVLQDPDIVFLDDPLSALDGATASKVVDRLILGHWADTTRVIVTHRLNHLEQFDRVVFLESGRIVAQGSLKSLRATCSRFQDFYSEHQRQNASGLNQKLESDTSTRSSEPKEAEKFIPFPNIPIDQKNDAAFKSNFTTDLEDRSRGKVDASHFWLYLKAMSGRNVRTKTLKLLVLIVLALAMPIIAQIIIAKWGDRATELGALSSQVPYFGAYSLLALLTTVLAWKQFVTYGESGVSAGR